MTLPKDRHDFLPARINRSPSLNRMLRQYNTYVKDQIAKLEPFEELYKWYNSYALNESRSLVFEKYITLKNQKIQ